MKALRYLIIGAVLTAPMISIGQTPNDNFWNHWYSGVLAGLNFDNGTVNSDTNSTISHAEAMSHPITGELLFYTDGRRVKDVTHSQMPNGIIAVDTLYEGYSGVFLITPHPGDTTLYYIFSVLGDTTGVSPFLYELYYSVVDMTLNGGLGDISIKNAYLTDSVYFFTTASSSALSNSYNAYFHRFGNNELLQYRILPDSGLIETPISHLIGPVLNWYGNGPEKLDVNRQGNVLALLYQGTTHLFILDPVDGTPVGHIPVNTQVMCGVEFSPSGQYLYCARSTNNIPEPMHQIRVYDLWSWNPPTILASEYLLPGTENLPVGQMSLKLAPTGQILVSNNTAAQGTMLQHLSTIDEPDLGPNGASFNYHSIDVGRNMEWLPKTFPIYQTPTTTGVQHSLNETETSFYPNPTTGTIRWNNDIIIQECMNVLGETVPFIFQNGSITVPNFSGVLLIRYVNDIGDHGVQRVLVQD